MNYSSFLLSLFLSSSLCNNAISFSPSIVGSQNFISSTNLCSTSVGGLGHKNTSRRSFIQSIGATIVGPSLFPLAPAIAADDEVSDQLQVAKADKVLVLGGTGLVGAEVVRQLKEKGIEVIATSRDGRDGTMPLDFSTVRDQADLETAIKSLSSGCFAVISCVGSIGTDNDLNVNAGSGRVAQALNGGTVKNFVYISVAPEVRDFARDITVLKPYMEGKEFSESVIEENFRTSAYTLIKPTFIYGGDEFKINPPRVANGYGKLVEGLLSLGPFRFAADVFPGFIGIALEPPVNVKDVAGAAVASALGSSTEHVLDTHDEIVGASKLL